MNKILLAALAGACFPTPRAGPVQRPALRYRRRRRDVAARRSSPKIISGGEEGSRLGFKGSEDLGHGLKAVFNLEARVELDTGMQ